MVITYDTIPLNEKKHARESINREIRDFMRNGDEDMLHRILFKMFIFHPFPSEFRNEDKKSASHATIRMIMNNPNLQFNLNFYISPQ